MSAAREVLAQVNEATRTGRRPFAIPDGSVYEVVHVHPAYDSTATSFLDPLELGDVHVFTDGSSLHYDYTTQQWGTKRGTIHSFGGARTLRRTKGTWQQQSAP